MKKPFYKKVWFWVLIIIVGSAISSLQGSPSDSSSNETTTSETNSETKVYKKNQDVVVGDVTYNVSKVSSKNKVGSTYLNATPKGVFLQIKIKVTNHQKDALMVDTNLFKLLSADKEYEADVMGSTYANYKEEDPTSTSFFLESINPDLSLEGFIVFDIPKDLAKASDLQLQVQTGIFGTEKQVINLN